MNEELRPDETDGPREESGRDAGPGVPWGLAGFLLSVILLVVFVVQNVQEVALRFLGWEGEYPLSLIIIVVIAISVLLDEFLGAALRRRRRTRKAEKEELRRLRREQ